MRDEDIVDLILNTAKQQTNIVDKRDDEIIHILKSTNEIITITDTITGIGFESHPVIWDQPVWNRFTWGLIP